AQVGRVVLPKHMRQPQMRLGAEAPVRPAVGVFAAPDLEAIEVPELSTGLTVHRERGINVFGVVFASVPSVLFGLYAYLLPFVLYAAWVGIALWDLARREVGKGAFIGWTAVILLVPFLGAIAYHLFARSPIPRWQRLTYVFGGLAAYVVIFGVGALFGGIVCTIRSLTGSGPSAPADDRGCRPRGRHPTGSSQPGGGYRGPIPGSGPLRHPRRGGDLSLRSRSRASRFPGRLQSGRCHLPTAAPA